jgi:large subunit ribosomal protein L4
MTTALPVLDTSGTTTGDFEVPAAWLEREKGEQAVHDTVVAYLAAQRAGTAATKTRTQVRGGGAKPWRQQGTGRARAGSIRSPLWRGGGVIFGPQPRDFSKKVNRKVKRLALRRVFTERLDEGVVKIVDGVALEAPRTRLATALLRALEVGEDVLIIVDQLQRHPNLVLATANLPNLSLLDAAQVNAYHVLLHKQILLTREGLDALGARIAATDEPAAGTAPAPAPEEEPEPEKEEAS